MFEKNYLIFLIFSLVVLQHAFGSPRHTSVRESQYDSQSDNIVFSGPTNCDQMRIPSWVQPKQKDFFSTLAKSICVRTQYKTWSVEEVAVIEDHLKIIKVQLTRKGLGNILNYYKGRPIALYRARSSLSPIFDSKGTIINFKKGNYKAEHLHAYEGIVLYDSFFDPNYRGIHPTIQRTTSTLLHEILHVIDSRNDRISYSEEFLALTKWKTFLPCDQCGPRFISVSDTPYVLISKYMEEFKALLSEGPYELALEYNRKIGKELGFPEIYSMYSPQETFADIGTYTILYPNPHEYVEQDMSNWFLHKMRDIHSEPL